jgi:hypothetical protein
MDRSGTRYGRGRHRGSRYFSPLTQSANAHQRPYGLAALAYLIRLLPKGLHAVAAQRFAKMCDRALSKIL